MEKRLLYTTDGIPVMRHGKPVYMREFIEEIKVHGFSANDMLKNQTLKITARTLENKKIKLQTTGRMTLGEIAEYFVGEMMK